MDGMCYLAQSVEAAGGLLEVLGLDSKDEASLFDEYLKVPPQDDASSTAPALLASVSFGFSHVTPVAGSIGNSGKSVCPTDI